MSILNNTTSLEALLEKANNLSNKSAEITIDDITVTEPMKFITTTEFLVRELPYAALGGDSVVHNDGIHIMGGGSTTTTKKYHYIWDGKSYTKTTNLPYNFNNGCAVMYEGEIHILGSDYNATQGKYHYKYDGSAWTKISTLPYAFKFGCAVVLNNEIHILGTSTSNYTTAHYKYNGSSWVSVSTLPFEFSQSYGASAVIYNNQIHIVGSNDDEECLFYKFDGSSWIKLSNTPYPSSFSPMIVHNDCIYLFGGDYPGYDLQYTYSKWDGTTWQNNNIQDLPEYGIAGSAIVEYLDAVHIIDTSGDMAGSNFANPHFEFDAKIYRRVV